MADLIMRISTGFWASKALHAVVELGVADVIKNHGGCATSEEIAADIPDTDPRSLFRVLRLVASLGIFDMQLHGLEEDVAYHKTYKFALNDAGRLLCSDNEPSMKSAVLLEAGDFHYNVWSGFLESAKTGKPAVSSVTGEDSVWAYNEKNPKQRNIFNAAMANFTAKETGQVLSHYDFSGFSSIVDVGGGLGSLLSAILRKYPTIGKGHLYDLPSVVKDVVVSEDLKDRVVVHGGSFLDENSGIPSGADAYIMKHIIHDWDDEKATEILKAIRKVMPEHGRVLLVEYVIPTGPRPCIAKALDLHMMTLLGAKERTAEEFAVLFRSAGLELKELKGAEGDVFVIEAKPSGQ